MAAVERIEGWRALGDNVIETIINKSERVKELKNKAKGDDLSAKEKKELTDEEREYKSRRKQIQEKLIKFATRIPAFMYLTDFRENTLQDVITKLEPDLFRTVTGLGMLLHQGIPAWKAWFGIEPKVTAELRAKIEATL